MRSSRSFTTDAALSAFASAAGRALALVAILVTTRVFNGETYGAWILVLSFAGFFMPFASLRFEIPILLAQNSRIVAGLTSIVFGSTIAVLAVLLIMSVFGSRPMLSWATGLSEVQTSLVYWTVPTTLVLALQLFVQTALMRNKQFVTLAKTTVIIPLTALVLTFFLPRYFEVTPELAGVIFLTSNLFGLFFARAPLSEFVKRVRPRLWNRKLALLAFREYAVYPKFTLPYSISISLTERITQIMIAKFYSLEALASFFVARQLLTGITSVIGGSLRNVFFAYSARENDEVATRERILRMLKLLTYLIAPAIAYAVFWIASLTKAAVGDAWETIPDMAWFCMFPAAIMMFTGPLDRVFDLVGKQKLSVYLQITSDICLLSAIVLAARTNVSAYHLVAVISFVTTAYNAIWLCLTLRAIHTRWRAILFKFTRFAAVFLLCLAFQYVIVRYSGGAIAVGMSIMLLLITLFPGVASLAASFVAINNRVPVNFRNILSKLP